MDVDQALDTLYGAPPEEFVSTRDRLARELEDAGERDAARELKARRKPPLAVWAVNQLSRRHAGELEDFLDASAALRQAQRKVLSGVKDSGLRKATERRARLADALTGRAGRILADAGSAAEAHLPTVHRALVAAAGDADVAEALRAGRLEAPPEPVDAFADAATLTLVPRPAEESDGREQARRLRAEAQDARTQARESRREATRARREAAKAERRWRRAEQQAEEAAAEAERADARLERAERAAREAR